MGSEAFSCFLTIYSLNLEMLLTTRVSVLLSAEKSYISCCREERLIPNVMTDLLAPENRTRETEITHFL